MGRTIEMTWVCSACQLQNLGRHKKCQRCGDPKDASEKFVMPGDTRAAPSVVDPALLRQAQAGSDWRCGYCGSDQMRLDRCCARCGADSAQGKDVRAAAPAAATNPVFGPGTSPTSGVWTPPALASVRSRRLFDAWFGPYGRFPGLGERIPSGGALVGAVVGTVFALFASCILLGAIASWWEHRPRAVVVQSTSWQRVVHVDRYRVVDHEAFTEAIPPASFEVRSLGQRHHHDEQVLDHYETVHYTERVQDGYDTESYTEQVSCGQDCTSEPQSCHEVCTSDDNGFASCHDVCSGGGQSCTTRYCSETRTRQVPRYRDEPRTREEPRYRAEPRYAEWFAYKHWEWVEDRVLRVAERSATPRWPAPGEVHLGAGLAAGERERERREQHYAVTFVDEDRHTYAFEPTSERAFRRLAPRSRHRIRVDAERVTTILPPER